ncbi:MAG: hypothetical protein DIU69_04625 [Bacillota bacterium]|nr:MAG: hypothetical protein DIU69_04625 [Bacillota bacterium]
MPHLDGGVVRSLPDALAAMEDAAEEMDRRYAMLEQAGQRDIGAYNAAQRAAGRPEMPYLVLIVDEFADLLLQGAGKEEKEMRSRFEAVVTRLAQKGRAAGVHMILTTQRPTRQSLPTTVKANLPVRVALRCASRLESEIVLDTGGAEMLQGRGDLLLLDPNQPDLIRAQAPLVTQDTIRRLVEWWGGRSEQAPPASEPVNDERGPAYTYDPGDLWERVLWALLDRIEELEPQGLAVRRENFVAARRSVVENVLREVAPNTRLTDLLDVWGNMGLIDGYAQDGWTKPVRTPSQTLVRMIAFRLPTDE